MARVSLLMLTCDDIDSAIVNLEATKGAVDEQIVVDSSGKADKGKLLRYAKKNHKLRVHEGIALGIPEPCMPFALNKCRNDWILLLDADEHPCPDFLGLLASFRPEAEANYITRYETPNRKFSTWQLRLFKKGSVQWLGLLHEHPQVLGRKLRLPRRFYLDHVKSGARRGYRKLQLFIREPRMRRILVDLYIQTKYDPSKLLWMFKRSMSDAKRTREEKEISRVVTSEGLIKFLGLDRKGRMEELIKRYRGKRQGEELLLDLVKRRYRQIRRDVGRGR
ncbi:MAG: hypothetical protein KGH94_03500 [Candidatus Micrarchaeota archaeon]|nr:hypothetical protein [Candidatus Micrarchaeota archaeon]